MRIVAASTLAVSALAITLAGCPAPIEGMRFLAQTPPIDIAYRKLTVALTADDYQITATTPGLHRAETGWRDAKEKEMTAQELMLGRGSVQTRVMIRLDEKERGFEVSVTPMLRYREGNSWHEKVADASHPLWEKWMQTVTSVVEVTTEGG